MKLTRRALMKWLGGVVSVAAVGVPVAAKAAATPRPGFPHVPNKTLERCAKIFKEHATSTETVHLAPKAPWVANVTMRKGSRPATPREIQRLREYMGSEAYAKWTNQ